MWCGKVRIDELCTMSTYAQGGTASDFSDSEESVNCAT